MPQFGSPGAAGINALQEFLMQRAMEERQRMLDEAAQQQQADASGLRQRDMGLREQAAGLEREQFMAGEAERTRVAGRQAQQDARQVQQDEIAGADRRQAQNQIGVRQMAVQGVRSGTSPRDAQLMAMGEGVELPDMTDPAETRRLALDDFTKRQGIMQGNEMAQIAEQGRQSRSTVAMNNGGRGTVEAGSDYAEMTADRTIAAIDSVLPKINAGTAGVAGNLLAKTGLYQPAVNVSAELSTVAGNIAFNALQQMRAASKTGGALGQVSERELDLLSSVEGSLRQNQSPENLREQLGKVRESMQRFKAAQAMGGDLQMGRTGAPTGTGGFVVVGKRPAQ